LQPRYGKQDGKNAAAKNLDKKRLSTRLEAKVRFAEDLEDARWVVKRDVPLMSDIKALLAHQKDDMSDIKALLVYQKELFSPFQPPSAHVPDQPALQVQSVISMLATGESEIFGQPSRFQAAPAALFHFPASHAVHVSPPYPE